MVYMCYASAPAGPVQAPLPGGVHPVGVRSPRSPRAQAAAPSGGPSSMACGCWSRASWRRCASALAEVERERDAAVAEAAAATPQLAEAGTLRDELKTATAPAARRARRAQVSAGPTSGRRRRISRVCGRTSRRRRPRPAGSRRSSRIMRSARPAGSTCRRPSGPSNRPRRVASTSTISGTAIGRRPRSTQISERALLAGDAAEAAT